MFDAQPPQSRLLAGRFEIQSTLGRGGMGVVYRALDLETQRPVAIKRPARAASERHLQRFRREGEALARLKHSGVVPVLHLGEERGEPFIVLALVGGHSLEEVLRGRGALPEPEVLELGRCLAEALAYAHERDVLHRDVKPDNVLLPQPDQPVLVDFGLAKFEEVSGGRLTATGAFAGTPGYASPEQLADAGKVDGRADVYGLGATLYALLTGGPPGGNGPAVNLVAVTAAGSFPSPRALRPEVSRDLSALVMRALAHDLDERIPSMAEFADQLAALERAQRPGGGGKSRAPLAAAIGLLTLSFFLGAGITAVLDPEESQSSPITSPSPSPSARPTLSPSPTPEDPGLTGQAATEAAAKLHETLRELQRADTAVAGLRFEAFSSALERAELIQTPTPAQSWILGRAYREQGRWADALAAYEAARQPGYELRAQLGRGLVLLSRLDGSEADRRAWVRRGREALATAARSVIDQPEGIERGAGLLAELALRLWELPRGIEVSGTSNRVRAAQALIPKEELLLRQEIHFAISLGLRKTRALSVAGTRLEVLEPAPAPMWSPGYALPLARRFSEMGLTRDSLRPTELLVKLTKGRGGAARTLARVQADAGLIGGLERSLAAPEAGLSATEARKLRATLARKCSKSGRILGHARTPGAYRFRLEPSEQDLILWVHVPEGTGSLDLEIQGSEADLDFYADQDGVPSSGAPWRSDDLTHTEHLEISTRSRPPLRPGIVQVRINRYRSWPEPVRGIVVIRTRSHDAPPRRRWKNAWECNLNGAPKDLRPLLGRSHELFVAGRGDEIEALLRPHQARVPRLALLRVKFLLARRDLKGIQALKAELEGLGQPLPLPLRYALVPTAAMLGDLEAAILQADEILASEPDLLELHLLVARFLSGYGRQAEALKRVEVLAKRDPTDLRIGTLLVCLRASMGEAKALDAIEGLLREDPAALLYDDQVELLIHLGKKRPEIADAVFAQIREKDPDPVPSCRLQWARYLLSRKRESDARELLRALGTQNLSPANKKELRDFDKRLR